MVWHEVGKYGVHHGRTLRSSPKSRGASPYSRAGYITKVIVNRANQLDTDEIKRQLKSFRIADGFDNDFVVEESRHRGFDPDNEWSRGYPSYDAVLSLNKKKRWLLPQMVRDKLDEERQKFEGEGNLKPRVVLIERKSVQTHALERGDCCDVLDSDATDLASPTEKGKKRKLCHVGDRYQRSMETEINYEVCESIPTNSWPNLRETRSNCKRFDFWCGDFRKCAKKSKSRTEMIKYCLSEVDMMEDVVVVDDDIPAIQSQGCVEDYSFEFDLDVYVTKALNCKSKNVRGKSLKIHHDNKLTSNVNPASSEAVACYGKGCVKLIDREEDANKTTDDSQSVSNEPPASMAQSTMETNTVVKEFKMSILIDSLHADDLQDRFKSRYHEAESIPRKFFIAATFCHHQYLLFEPQRDRETDQDLSCEVLVTLVCDNRENTYSHESDSYTITNSCNRLAQLDQKRGMSISDIVNIFDESCNCCQETVESNGSCDPKEEFLKIRKTVIAYDVLNSFVGHKTEMHSLAKAPKELFLVPHPKFLDKTAARTYDDHKPLYVFDIHSKTCEICYTEFSDSNEGFTALLACQHWFCNDCWKMHLVAQLQLGKTMVSCPVLKCSEVVDDATFMSLAPKSYFRYKTLQQDRALEMNKQWNWCPGDKCRLVAKVTKSEDIGFPRDDEVDVKEATPLPCVCSCSQVWCFGCQEEPHWPASCHQAQTFRAQTKKYQETIATATGDDRVTSVSVRRCPNCQYPIEKNGGCPHMMCSKCNADFCWICLGAFNYDTHNCEENAVTSEEIELTDSIGNARFNKHVRILTAHKKARKVENLFKIYKQVEDISNAVATHHKLMQHKLLNTKIPSKTHAFLALCHERNAPEKLKLMVDTKFISHSVIEGASMHMATSKTKRGHHVLQRLTNDLHFVIVRLEYYLGLKLEDLCAALDQAMALVEAAKATIIAIGQVTREYCDKH